jgi:hypothetical protein
MKSKINLIIFVFGFLFLFVVGSLSVQAQCQVVITDGDGNIQSVTNVSCEFPVKLSMADPVTSQTDYTNQKDYYLANFPNDSEVYGKGFAYMIIPQADLDAMPISKQEAILANPELFHIQ